MIGPHVDSTRMTLRTVPHPDGSSGRVFLHEDWHSACTHLQRRLLTAPECEAWGLVIPGLDEIVDPGDANQRWRSDRRMVETQGLEGPTISDRYGEAVAAAGRDATRLAWHVTADRITVALGTSGVLIVIDTALRTAFLPGQGDPAIVRETRGRDEPRFDGPDPRSTGMRSSRSAAGMAPAEGGRSGTDRVSREWTAAQRLDYGVFRPAVPFIRAQVHLDFDARGRRLHDYGRLKGVLPPMSGLKYQHWLELRETARQQ